MPAATSLEEPLNTGAFDGSYKKKGERHAESGIAAAKEMAVRDSWKVCRISFRNARVPDPLKAAIKRGNDEYGH